MSLSYHRECWVLARKLGVTFDILHTAQSLFHDHVQAKRASLAGAWIDRPALDFQFPTMMVMAEAIEREKA